MDSSYFTMLTKLSYRFSKFYNWQTDLTKIFNVETFAN